MAVGKSRSWVRMARALAVLLAAVFVLFWIMRVRYENRLRQQLWPDHPSTPTVISNVPAGAARTVLLLGDSRMAQWGLPPLAGWSVINAGTGGFTTGQIRLCAPALLDQFRPDAVVLQGGINDLKYLGMRPEMTDQVVSLALSNLLAAAGDAAQHHCQVILLTTWPADQPGLARRLVWSKAVSDSVVRLNRQLQIAGSTRKSIRVLDLFKEAGLGPGAGFYLDALHLRPAAYELLTPLLKKELDKTQP